MPLIHTSDWHLGKRLGPYSRIDEQEQFLQWLFQTVVETQTEALLISGDIFDTPHPPVNALKLYFNFLEKLTSKTPCKVFIIAGNHDNGHFLEAPLPFLKKHKVFIAGKLSSQDIQKHDLKIDNTPVELTMMPFFRTKDILELKDQGIDGPLLEEQYLLECLKDWLDKAKPKKLNSILMAHHNFGSFLKSESEHSLSLSGIESLPLELFNAWTYLALGHIHKPQIIKQQSPRAVYSGSPIAFRFSEIGEKSVSLLSFSDASESLTHQKLTIPTFKPLLKLKVNTDNYQEIIEKQMSVLKRDDTQAFIEVTLEQTKHHPHIVQWIKEQISQSGSQLISLRPLFKNIQEENSFSRDEIHHQSINDLFKKYQFNKFQLKDEEVLKNFNTFLEDYREHSSEQEP